MFYFELGNSFKNSSHYLILIRFNFSSSKVEIYKILIASNKLLFESFSRGYSHNYLR